MDPKIVVIMSIGGPCHITDQQCGGINCSFPEKDPQSAHPFQRYYKDQETDAVSRQDKEVTGSFDVEKGCKRG
jgi:hypothetical protein